MSKIIGLLVVWGCENWINHVAKQCLEQCDEVIACCSPHSPSMIKYRDRTEEILKSYKDIKILDNYQFIGVHSQIKADMLNKMIKMSSIKVGDYIFIRDSDELYDEKSYNEIKRLINEDKYNEILFKSYYFYINMQHYLISEHDRLFKYEFENQCFYPTQQFPTLEKRSYTVPLEHGMHHYGLLLNPFQKRDMWSEEYIGTNQYNKVNWINLIYKNYDLKNEKYWVELNKEISGIKSPWFSPNFECDNDGTLFKFNGKHPDILKNSGFENIVDFRKEYNFV